MPDPDRPPFVRAEGTGTLSPLLLTGAAATQPSLGAAIEKPYAMTNASLLSDGPDDLLSLQ